MIKREFTFGANILENLTTGMYRNPLVLFREYIQNACDSIDNAVSSGLLETSRAGKIEVWINDRERNIEIIDNGLGIPANDFAKVLGNIADSDKTLGEDKGFRGIGRLCGLAYCKKLKFLSKFKGESKISILECNAEVMRKMLKVHQSKEKKYRAEEILSEIYKFSDSNINEGEINEHYFKVILEDVNSQNNELLDTLKIKEYLSFVAPVPYQNTFYYRSKIYDKAKELGQKMDEYSIKINGEDIYKKYVTTLKDTNGVKYDEIRDIEFKTFYDAKNKLIAWMWVGISQFKRAIPKINIMRGIRLRKHNIQIGDEDALQKLFKEDRGNNYFIGEVFAVDSDLIPNSQRDYFNQNDSRENLERLLKQYFDNEIQNIYYLGSYLNSRYNKIEKFEELKNEISNEKSVGFAGEEHKLKRERELKKAEEVATKASNEINQRINKISPDSLSEKVVKIIKNNRKIVKSPIKNATEQTNHVQEDTFKKEKKTWRVDNLTKLSRRERKLIGQIFDIIFITLDKDTAEKIVNKIEEELK